MAFHGSEHLFLSVENSDVTFIVENKAIPGHKRLLADGCPYFNTMLLGATEESKMSTIPLKHVSYKMFVEVLRCVYQRKVEIAEWSPKEVEKLIRLADEYQFPEMGCAVADSINVYTQLVAIIELIVDVANRLKNLPRMETFAAALRRSTKLLLENQHVFDKLSMEQICLLIDTGFWHSADQRLVFLVGNWRKTASIEDKKLLLSKIDWKSLPAKYSEPLLRLVLENHEDRLQVEDWTDGLTFSNDLVELIAGVYTSFSGRFWISDFHSLFTEFPAMYNNTSKGSVFIFFREQVTTVTKIKFTYDKEAEITLRVFGNKGAAVVSCRKISEYWEFILPSNFHFSATAIEITNPEAGYAQSYEHAYNYISALQFLSE